MRIDAGLVLDKLHPGTVLAPAPSPPGGVGLNENIPSTQLGRGLNPAAHSELAEGLKWIWICLGRDNGLPAETAALEACAAYGETVSFSSSTACGGCTRKA